MNPIELRARTRDFALRVVKLVQALPKTPVADVLGKQLLRSATSVGANYRAACRAQTKPVFVTKMSIVVEEADETIYWLELIRDAELVKPEQLSELIDEAEQICKIMVTSRQLHDTNDWVIKQLDNRSITQSLNIPGGDNVCPGTMMITVMPIMMATTRRSSGHLTLS
jgi:four helix bundle protein